MTDLQNNYFKVLLFIMMIKQENKDSNIKEFMNKFEIDIQHKEKIDNYFDYFIEVKKLFLNQYNTK